VWILTQLNAAIAASIQACAKLVVAKVNTWWPLICPKTTREKVMNMKELNKVNLCCLDYQEPTKSFSYRRLNKVYLPKIKMFIFLVFLVILFIVV